MSFSVEFNQILIINRRKNKISIKLKIKKLYKINLRKIDFGKRNNKKKFSIELNNILNHQLKVLIHNLNFQNCKLKDLIKLNIKNL